MDVCKVYDHRTIAIAWQYNGDIESAPDWVNQPPYTSLERCDDKLCLAIKDVGEIPLNEGDWLIKSGKSNIISVYCDDGFSSLFTVIPEKEEKHTDSKVSQKYRSKPVTVHAWQYTGQSDLPRLPHWVADLILHHRLGYHLVENSDKELFQFYYEGVWVPLLDGDWLVRYGEDSLEILSDTDFKEYFEEIK